MANYSNSTDSAQSDDEVVSNVDPMVAIDDPDVKVRVQIARQESLSLNESLEKAVHYAFELGLLFDGNIRLNGELIKELR